ncbi:YybH family protein [Micromonospora maritima]|uniref:YybH family protein n=1 Tax=Micromonospora maritima TaxID=986711 RepID=UPI00157C86CD|nr:SgcJ/EcaC family oxidoreductase [Micromonospora maritima]
MTTDQAKQELRELIDKRVAAVARRDAGALAAHQAADVLAFNVLPPLRLRGADQMAPQTEAWFDAYADGPGYEVRDLHVDADGDLGYCAFLYHVTGTLRSGTDVSMWVRATLVCRRRDGRWVVVHDHESIPWDPETGQGLADLDPDG